MWDRQSGHSAHFVLDLERTAGGIRIACVRHRYHALECACGVQTAARPGVGVLSTVPGRSRDLLLSEACLVGPALATFIAALSVRYHVSRAKIREFLAVWFGVPLSVGTLDRCIREVGVACEPVVEDLLGDLRQAGVIHADETPWKQHGRLRWLWVVLSSSTAIFHIGSRHGDEIRDLIGDAFLGWLVSDGYAAYRSFKKRQRCLAHLIRKGVALAGGLNPVGVNFGDWLLREMRGLIHEVAEGTGARIINPMLARLNWGADLDGYCSDCTRTLATGSVDGQLTEVYELVRSTQAETLGQVLPGAAGADVDAFARDRIAEAGHGERFGHGLGHGVGLEIHEGPTLSRLSKDSLAAGNVVTVEPGVYLPDAFGVRIEDLVVVADGEPEVLSGFPKELTEVE